MILIFFDKFLTCLEKIYYMITLKNVFFNEKI